MITHPDHKKPTYLEAHMTTMQVTPVPEPQQTNSIGNSNQDSDCIGTDLFLHIGQYHYLRTDNGDVDHEFNVPIVVESIQS